MFPEPRPRHNAAAVNLGTELHPDWRGTCVCGWASRPGWATTFGRPARTREQAEGQAERHNREQPKRDQEVRDSLRGRSRAS